MSSLLTGGRREDLKCLAPASKVWSTEWPRPWFCVAKYSPSVIYC